MGKIQIYIGDGFVRIVPKNYMSIVLTIEECNDLASGKISTAADIGTVVRYYDGAFSAYYLGDASRYEENVSVGCEENARTETRNKIACSIWEEHIPRHALRVFARLARMVGKNNRKELEVDLSRYDRHMRGSGIVVECGERECCNDENAINRVLQIAKNATARWTDRATVRWSQSYDRSCVDWCIYAPSGKPVMNGCLAHRGD